MISWTLSLRPSKLNKMELQSKNTCDNGMAKKHGKAMPMAKP